ncbi:hypothetical protein HPB50_012410 [Hyalomma asiaticum]|uniref:Uncharacterized protein n=1 Tax=Hyalomma asiaticum TaxID=266040 RepID=A0ACB7SXY8_HYAAI|nr:hypothetical protein HPB50_012410 [Hyalomma asiaticum]
MDASARGSAGKVAAERSKSVAASSSGASAPGHVVSPTRAKGHDSTPALRHRHPTSRRSQSALSPQHPTDTPTSSATTTSPYTADGAAHASDAAAPAAETSEDAKPSAAQSSQSTTKSLKSDDTRNALGSLKARAKSPPASSPSAMPRFPGKRVAGEGTRPWAHPPRSPPPKPAVASVDKKEAGLRSPIPNIATASLLRPMLKHPASNALAAGSCIKRPTSIDAGALSESPAATEDIESATTRRKSSVRFGATTIREISHVTASLIEHHRQMVALFLIGFLSVLVSAGGVLLFFVLRQEHVHYLNGCSTMGCKRAVRDLELLIDVSIDPCHDFYGHVCRRWLRNNNNAGYVERAARNLLRDLNTSLNEVDEPNRVSPRLFSLAQFYQLCHRFISARTLQLSDMLHPFKQYADLLALSTFPEVIGRVIDLSLVRGVRTLLDIRLVRLSKAAAVKLRISCGISLAQKCCDNSSDELRLYLRTLLNAVSETLLENNEGPRRTLDPSDIAGMDIDVRPLMVAPINEQNYNISVFELLSRRVSSQQWLAAINTALPARFRMGKHSRVIVTNVDAITKLLDYIERRMDSGIVYVFVQVLMEAMRFDYLRRRSAEGPYGAVRTCLRATWSALSGAKDLVASKFVGAHETMARAVFDRVLTSVLQYAEGSSWMGDLIKRNAKVALGSVSLRSFAATVFNASDKEDVHDVPTSPELSVFPSLFMEIRSARQSHFLEDPPRLRAGTDEYGSDDFFFFESRVVYDVVSNSLRVPETVRREPILYGEDVPLEFALGTLGMVMARELLRAAVPSRMPSLWTSQEQVAFLRYDQCVDSLAREAMNITLERPQDNQAPEYYFWLQGARAAYAALSASYADERRAANWQTFWRAAQRTFFRRLCLLSCRPQYDSPEERRSVDPLSANQRSPAVPARVSCLLPLLNMPEFIEAFECSKTAPACAVS